MKVYVISNTFGTRKGVDERKKGTMKRKVVPFGPFRIMPKRDLEISENLFNQFKGLIDERVNEGLLTVSVREQPDKEVKAPKKKAKKTEKPKIEEPKSDKTKEDKGIEEPEESKLEDSPKVAPKTVKSNEKGDSKKKKEKKKKNPFDKLKKGKRHKSKE